MNGVHDMGGMHGFGPVLPEENEPVFHAAWEAKMLAMQRAMGYTGAWNIDASRAAQEQLPAGDYLALSYYGRWAYGMTQNLLRAGLVDAAEIDAGHALAPAARTLRAMRAANVARAFVRGAFARPARSEPAFKPGESVRARRINPESHTRLPRYARGCVGVIEAVRGCHVYPDSSALGRVDDAEWLYAVVFDGRTLWGPDVDPALKVSIEAFEPYLEPA